MRTFLAGLTLLIVSLSFADDCAVSIKGTPRVEWTAYKFTEKKPVQGEIKGVEFTAPSAATVDELISHLSFVIDLTKSDSGDVARDTNLRESFFKLMKSNASVRGHVVSYDKASSNIKVEINMNGVTKVIPFNLKQEAITTVTKTNKKQIGPLKSNSNSKEKSFTYVAAGEIDILDFRMKNSFDSLHKVCQDLHKGPDGVSKTWSQVGLTIYGEASESCTK